MIRVTRKTTESIMEVRLTPPPVKSDYRSKIETPLPFLNHMIEHIVWRSGYNVETHIELPDFDLTHVVCEDLGITMGKAFAAQLQQNTPQGVYGFGDAVGIIDEARAFAAVSFESRAYFELEAEDIPVQCEGMDSADLSTFLEGFAQGACCTLQIQLQKGVNGHHIWEAVYRAVGLALGRALEIHPERAGMTAGVAGGITFEVEG